MGVIIIKNDNSKNISWNFSGAVEGNVGSVPFQIVPCSSLYFFSRSIGPFQYLVNANYRVLICCSCQFQSGSLFFVSFGFLCLQVSSVSNFWPHTRGQGVTYLGSFVQLCWGEGGTQQTNITGVCGECSQCMDHTGLAPAHHGMCFPGLHCLGSKLLCRGTVQSRPCVSCTSQSWAAQVQVLGYCTRAQTWLGVSFVPFPGLSTSASQVLGERTVPGGPCILITSLVWLLGFPGALGRHHLRCAYVLSRKLISGCDPPGRCQPSRIPGRHG